jgi:hypothetical protein
MRFLLRTVVKFFNQFKMNNNKFLLGMLLVCLPFFCLCTGNVKVDDVTCLGEGKGGGSPILSKLDLGCCPGLKKISADMGVDAQGVCRQAIDGGVVCAKCGDGKCGIGENKCNCPSDCSAACAPEGEAVFDNPGMGPLKCCDANAGIKPSTHIDTTYNICSDPDRSGSKGICSVSWAKTCGNGVCDSGEDKCNCLQDCPPPECAKDGEQVYMRSIDGPVSCCSDDSGIKYDHRLENGACTAVSGQFSPVGVCVVGWQKTCGDGACGSGENRCNCPQDCGNSETDCVNEGERIRGNGEENGRKCCSGLTEVFDQWKLDSDGICHALDNYGYYCLKCGDGTCGKGENKCNCAKDCKGLEGQECDDSSDCVVAVDLGGCCACPRVLPRTSLDSSKFVVYERGKDYSSMLPDECRNAVCSPCGPVGRAVCQSGKCVNAPVCGNIYCERGEDARTCPQDCGTGAVCGNGFCEAGENKTSCLQDCAEKRVVCGDNYCTTGENESNCPVDCGPHRPVCGNGFCEKPYGENATNCAPDCEINSVCGNLACEEDEDKATCPQDCADHT